MVDHSEPDLLDEEPVNGNHHPDPLPKAYEDPAFLNSSGARPIRILAEYLEPLQRLRKKAIKDTVVFYGSARIQSPQEAEKTLNKLTRKLEAAQGSEKDRLRRELVRHQRQAEMSHYYQEARDLAYRLTEWSLSLEENQRFIVCSGGGPGIMEAANKGATEAGGQSIGMNISISTEQYPNPYISEDLSFEFHYFFMRKFWFVYLAKALVVFPGGFGTMDELFELLTLRQTEKIRKPISVLIYGSDFWDRIIDFDRMVEWGVIGEEDLKLFHKVDTVEDAFALLRDHFEREFVGKRRYLYL
ncbi:TIGR00730 family Rossman fold protein [candidate division KSB1 bacterium]|nr:TIGR00730 family Rossman fold protein [candidate division KSB1 bacterium]